jgi:tetratricopeptide (TPR) repeat protein
MSAQSNLSKDKEDEMTNYEILMQLNICMCLIKLQKYREAHSLSLFIIQMDPANMKAYYRAAQSSMEMGEYDQCRSYIKKAEEIAHEKGKETKKEGEIEDLMKDFRMLEKKNNHLEQIQIQKEKNHIKKMKNASILSEQ